MESERSPLPYVCEEYQRGVLTQNTDASKSSCLENRTKQSLECDGVLEAFKSLGGKQEDTEMVLFQVLGFMV